MYDTWGVLLFFFGSFFLWTRNKVVFFGCSWARRLGMGDGRPNLAA
jgi:hypothetical protein